MKIIDFLTENTKWLFYRNCFTFLKGETQSLEQIKEKLRQYSQEQPVTDATQFSVELYSTEFCLYGLRVKGRSLEEKFVKAKRCEMQSLYLRVRDKLSDKPLPSVGKTPRLVSIVEIIATGTQGVFDESVIKPLFNLSKQLFTLTKQEERLFDDVIDLYKCKLYCLCLKSFEDDEEYAVKLAVNLFNVNLTNAGNKEISNTKYDYAVLQDKDLTCVVDCFGQTQSFFGDNTAQNTEERLYRRGLRVSLADKDGEKIAQLSQSHVFRDKICTFYGKSKSLSLYAKTTIRGNRQFCFFEYYSKYNKSRRVDLTAEMNLLAHTFERYGDSLVFDCGKTFVGLTYFNCGLTQPIEAQFDGGKLKCIDEILFAAKERKQLTFVLSYAFEKKELLMMLGKSNQVDFLKDKFLFSKNEVKWCANKNATSFIDSVKHTLLPTTDFFSSERIIVTSDRESEVFDYKHVLKGNMPTLFDQKGECATLLGGFLTLPKQEKIYVEYGKTVVDLTACSQFFFDGEAKYRYENEQIAVEMTVIGCEKGKKYLISINSDKECRIMLDMKFFKKRFFSYENGSFVSTDGLYRIVCNKDVLRYTSVASEVDSMRYPERLSNNLSVGEALSVLVNGNGSTAFELTTEYILPQTQPILTTNALFEEMNVYLQQTLFEYHNGLTKPNAVTLALINLYNSAFVKDYLLRLIDYGFLADFNVPYFDGKGGIALVKDRFVLALALLAYVQFTNDRSLLQTQGTSNYLSSVLATNPQNCSDKIALLFCNKIAASVFADRLPYVDNLTRIGATLDDNELAQAKLLNLIESGEDVQTFRNAKKIQTELDLPLSYFYWGAVCGAYGIRISNDTLYLRPGCKCKPDDCVVNLNGRVFDVKFDKSQQKEMTVNGVTCYRCFNVKDLPCEKNVIVVKY